jgi:hypothetical protein
VKGFFFDMCVCVWWLPDLLYKKIKGILSYKSINEEFPAVRVSFTLLPHIIFAFELIF